MAKKLSKNTSIAKAKSLKANVTRKFDKGGPKDPPIIPAKPADVQPFSQHYQDNAAAFNAADSAARSYMTDWFTQRANSENYPQHKESATAMADYLQKSGKSVYVPEPEVKEGENPQEAFKNMFSGIKMKDAQAFANTADYSPVFAPEVPKDYQTALSQDKFSTPNEPKAEIISTGTPLTYNTAYYRGDYGKDATTHLEEQLHLASTYGELMSKNHAKSFGEVGNFINPGNIKMMGYQNMDKRNLGYLGDVQEFYPRLMSARRTFGLSPIAKYDNKAMGEFLDKGYENIAHDMKILVKDGVMNPEARNNPDLIYKEPGQMEHLIEFYKELGYPTPSSEFSQQKSQKEIDAQKAAAAEKFRMSNEILAMEDSADDNSGLPRPARYGGYQTYKTGGVNKKKKPANDTYPPSNTDPEKPYAYGSTIGIPSQPYQIVNGKYQFTLPDGTTWSTNDRGQADSINAYFARGWGFTGERDSSGGPAWARIPKEVTDPKKLTIENTSTPNVAVPQVSTIPKPSEDTQSYPRESYSLQQTGNGGGVAYVHKTIRDKNGNVVKQELVGSTLTRDWMTPEEEDEFFSAKGGSKSVQYNPKAKIYSNVQEPLQIVESERGLKEKSDVSLQKEVTQVEAEKTAQQLYEQQLRDKEKARLKKTQDEIEADKAANKKAMGGFGDPEDPEKPWRHKIKSKDGNYLYNRVGTNAIQDYDKSTVRRTLKGFITGAPKPKETIPRTSDAKFAEGGMNKNMLNANSTTGPRSEQSWQDPGVNRFSGNTNGVNADYYFKKGGLKSKVSSKFAKLKL